MKETIAEIDGTRGWLFEKINRIDRQLARLNKKKKKQKFKSIELEMKKERLQQTTQRY